MFFTFEYDRIESPRESNFTFNFSKKKEERRELLFENFSRSVKLHIYKNNKQREIELRVKREKIMKSTKMKRYL